MHHRKALGALMALALVAGAAPAAAQWQQPAEQAMPGLTSITLITGDKVLVDHTGNVVTIQPSEGREQVGFSTEQVNGHTHVVPLDVAPLLANGKLDRRLFDIRTLLDFRYDDAHTTRLPLIIDGHGVLAARSAESWKTLSTSAGKVWLDGIRKPSLDRSTTQIGAPAAWRAGYTGKGVKVAVLDTGVDTNHPDLKGKQLAERNFTTDPDIRDKVGHGTHVAATIASNDATYRGVAPDVQLLNGKVCVSNGCTESAILDGMRWAAEEGAAVVNLSLGGGDTPEIDPLEEAVGTLSARYGTLFVIAAGNSGAPDTVASPASADAALAVGAVDRNNDIAPFSSRGPRTGDGAIKPEVTAPGVGIVAAKAGTTERWALSGTSMATPHVAGAAALLAQQHPDWTGSQIKSALISSAQPNASLTPFDQGSGRIDLARAITQRVTAEPGNLHLGFHSWPHADDKPSTRNLAYVNPTDAPVTLSLTLKTKAPTGLFNLGAGQITVPAKGKASVPVIADTRAGDEDGNLTGTVIATAGDLVLRTPVSVTREVESYNVTFEYLDRDGKPAANYSAFLAGLDVTKRLYPYEADGTVTARLPKGNYVTNSYIRTGRQPLDIVAQPNLSVTADATVRLDASKARPIDVKFPEATTGWPFGMVGWVRQLGGNAAGVSLLLFGGFAGTGITQVGPDLPADQLGVSIGTDARLANEPDSYFRMAWSQSGGLPTGFVRAPRKEDMAKIDNTLGSLVPGKSYLKGMYPVYKNGGSRGSSLFQLTAGARPVEYVTTDTGWQPLFYQQGQGIFLYDVNLTGPPRWYQPGQRVAERMNFGVFGPSLPAGSYSVARHQDSMYASLSLLADSNGGSGYSKITTARTALYRDGVKLGETDRQGYGFFENVPGGAADFRVEAELTRPFELSSEVRAAWTFRSARTTGDWYEPLPLTMVRFAPKINDDNAARAGLLHRVPLVIEQQTGADNGQVSSLAVEYSLDDGKTWRRAGVSGRSALIYHPNEDGYMSLRAKTVDTKGNTSEVTIIRAYKIAT